MRCVTPQDARTELLRIVPGARLLVGDGACMCLWGPANSVRVAGRTWLLLLENVRTLLASARDNFFDLPVVIRESECQQEEEHRRNRSGEEGHSQQSHTQDAQHHSPSA